MDRSSPTPQRAVAAALASLVSNLSDPIVAEAFRRAVRTVDLREIPADEGDPLVRAIERLSRARVGEVGQKLIEVAVQLEVALKASRGNLDGTNVRTGIFNTRSSDLLAHLAEVGGRSWKAEDFRQGG